MTCGKWGQPGHETHLCNECELLYRNCIMAGICRPGKDCMFKQASLETKVFWEEHFSKKKVECMIDTRRVIGYRPGCWNEENGFVQCYGCGWEFSDCRDFRNRLKLSLCLRMMESVPIRVIKGEEG